MSKKIILCEGDSWTAGDIFNPKLSGTGIDSANVNHIANSSYRLPKVWPGKLEKIINKRTLNTSVSGSSNDGIVRRVVGNVFYLLNERKYNPEDIFVIVGWSSPERKDFYFRDKKYESLETIYPHEIGKKYGTKELDLFHKLYVSYFWNPEEYVLRYLHQLIYINSFLKNLKIKHLFFNAFYDSEKYLFDDENEYNFLHFIKHQINSVEMHKIDQNSLFSFDNLFDEVDTIYNNYFIKKSFQQFIKEQMHNDKNITKYFDKHHPTELSHNLWANYIKDFINL